ncbi:MAG: BolA/IbaG family iron-sulfur metabolism protein [Actinomycetota bacterium]|nr:BolA/IbaG family iron-sulfur metabolism protein [Actinomycetota bacterium]
MTTESPAATPEELQARIEAAIPGARASVSGDGHHFSALVCAPAFRDLSRIAQHRLVYEVFGSEIGGRIHALSIQTNPETYQ